MSFSTKFEHCARKSATASSSLFFPFLHCRVACTRDSATRNSPVIRSRRGSPQRDGTEMSLFYRPCRLRLRRCCPPHVCPLSRHCRNIARTTGGEHLQAKPRWSSSRCDATAGSGRLLCCTTCLSPILESNREAALQSSVGGLMRSLFAGMLFPARRLTHISTGQGARATQW